MANGQRGTSPGTFLRHIPGLWSPGISTWSWNTIPGLYSRKMYMRTLVIEKREWDQLSDPSHLEQYWEPTQEPSDFHWTLGLAFCLAPFHDCERRKRDNEFVVSVAVVRKPSGHAGLPFSDATAEFRDNNDRTPTLLLVWLHRKSHFVPDIYYYRYGKHFTIMHDSGQGHNVGDPQKFLGALLHNTFASGTKASPKAKLPPAYLHMPALSPLIDSCTREYRDWCQELVPEGVSLFPLEEHFIWLSSDDTPYENDPGSAFVPPDFTLRLPPVRNWPCRAGSPPWVLDPEEYPKPVLDVPDDSAVSTSLDGGKKKKKHRHSRKSDNLELKVTDRGMGADTPIWSTAASSKGLDSSSSSVSEGDSGLGSNLAVTPRKATDTAPSL